MSAVSPHLAPAVPSSPAQSDGRSGGAVRGSARRDVVDTAVSLDSAVLSSAARRRLSLAADEDVRLADPVAIARQVAELLQQAADTGAVHRIAVGTLARLVE